MTRCAIFFAGTLIALMPAMAQQRASTEWRTKPAESRFSASNANDASRALRMYAGCVARDRYARARVLVNAPYGSDTQTTALHQIVMGVDDSCMTSDPDDRRMKFNGVILAGAVGEALVLNDYPDLPAVVSTYAPSIDAEKAEVAKLAAVEAFGRCVVRRSPGGVLKLLATAPGTVGEDQAMKGLMPELNPCLPVGNTVRLNRMFLRGITGIAAYRLAQQVRPRDRAQNGKAAR